MESGKKHGDVSDLHALFEQLTSALQHAANARSVSIVHAEAERLGLLPENGNEGKLSERWNLDAGRSTLALSWRCYDPSGPFNIQPDINGLVLALLEDAEELRRVELRFED